MATSPNLLMDLQVTGNNAGTWGTITNDNLSIIDNRFGGRQAVSVASSNVTLTDAQAENVFQRLTGTLGANIDLIFPASSGGFYLISNEATGSFDITVKPSGGTGVTVPQGAMTLVFINPSQTTALKINVVSTSAANTFTALQTFSAGIAVTGAASPTSNDAAALGTGSASWSDLFLATGGVINWANGDVTVTHSSNTLAFAGASSGYTFTGGPVVPATNDAAALGTTSLMWSDLFLASGGVINFNNGNVLLTHSTGQLALTGNLTVSGTTTFTGTATMNGGGTLGNDSSDTVVIKGTTVSAFMAGLLSSANAGALRTAIGLGTGDTVTFAGLTFPGNNVITMGGVNPFSNLVYSNQILDAVAGTTKGAIPVQTGSGWGAVPPP